MTEQSEGYKARVIGDAQGEAARFTSLLAEYDKAPQIMRQRLYLDTMQRVYGSASKVMVDTRGSNSMLYLPLDKIIEQAARGDANKPAPTSTPAPGNAAPPTSRAPTSAPSLNTLTRDRSR